MKQADEIRRVLQDELVRLQNELKEIEDFNRNAWESCGSELCVGEMLGKEEAVAAKIALITKFFDLTVGLSEEDLRFMIQNRKKRCEHILKEVADLQSELKRTEQVIKTLLEIAKISGITLDN